MFPPPWMRQPITPQLCVLVKPYCFHLRWNAQYWSKYTQKRQWFYVADKPTIQSDIDAWTFSFKKANNVQAVCTLQPQHANIFFPNLLFPNACFHQSHIPLLPFPGRLACYFFYSTDLKWVSLQQHHNENQCDPNRSKPLQCYVFTVVQKQRNCRVPVSFLFIVRHCYIERVKTSFHITYPEPSNLWF